MKVRTVLFTLLLTITPIVVLGTGVGTNFNGKVWIWFDDRETYSLSFQPQLLHCEGVGFLVQFCGRALRGAPGELYCPSPVNIDPERFFVSFDPVELVIVLEGVQTPFVWIPFYYRNTGLTENDFGHVGRYPPVAASTPDGVNGAVWPCSGGFAVYVDYFVVGLLNSDDAGPFNGAVAGATEFCCQDWSHWSFGLFNIGRQMSAGRWTGEGGIRQSVTYTAELWQNPADVLIAEITEATYNMDKTLILDAVNDGKIIIVPGGPFTALVSEASAITQFITFENLTFEYASVGGGGIVNGSIFGGSGWTFNWVQAARRQRPPNWWKPLDNYVTIARGFNEVAFLLSAPTLTCSGFDPPMDSGPVTVRGNRALPFKAQLLDVEGYPVTDLDVAAFPVVQVVFQAAAGGDPVDVTGDAFPVGMGTDSNGFEYNPAEQVWQYNLKTKNHTAVGTYIVTIESGDPSEYRVDPSCSGTFIRFR